MQKFFVNHEIFHTIQWDSKVSLTFCWVNSQNIQKKSFNFDLFNPQIKSVIWFLTPTWHKLYDYDEILFPLIVGAVVSFNHCRFYTTSNKSPEISKFKWNINWKFPQVYSKRKIPYFFKELNYSSIKESTLNLIKERNLCFI
jgi:hypothetical protein